MPLSTLAHARRANRGKFAENLLATTHQVYRLEGLASLTPIPSPIGRKSRRDENARPGQFTAWYKQKSTSDYLGVIAPEGRALAVELKSVESPRFALSQLPEHQHLFLEDWAAKNGLAYLLVVFLNDTLYPPGAVLKWPAFLVELDAAHQAHRSFAWEDLATEFRTTAAIPDTGTLAVNYLPAIRIVEARLAIADQLPHRMA